MKEHLILAIVIACILLVAIISVVVILIVLKKKNKITVLEFPALLTALGGLDNISNLMQKGSRISVNVNDKKIIDKEKIKEEGIDTIVVSNKKVTMVVDNKKAVQIFEYLNNKQSELN